MPEKQERTIKILIGLLITIIFVTKDNSTLTHG